MAYTPTFTRDPLGKWGAEQNTGITQVVAGSDAYIMEDEFNLIQWIQNEARADLVRAQIPSGVVDYNGVQTGLADGAAQRTGGVYGGTGQNFTNALEIDRFKAFLNGYQVTAANFNTTPGSAPYNNLVQLATPPNFGTRDDLVFLEAWFQVISGAGDTNHQADQNLYQYGGVNSGTVTNDLMDTRVNNETTRRMQLRWRIRTAAGVDFNTYTDDGFCKHDVNGYPSNFNGAVRPQGGNAAPITNPIGQDTWSIVFSSGYQRGANSAAPAVAKTDTGLYIAGDGSASAKSTLGTADGYVYALPLFRVKRRNNGGYRADNLSGARDFNQLKVTTTVSGLTTGQTATFNLLSGQGAMIKAGDRLLYQGVAGSSVYVDVISVSGDTITGTVSFNGSWNNASDWFAVKSDRPDGLYSNIIDASDIIDLRHKVSLTGFNYQQLLESNFDSLIRGQLTTKDTVTAKRERFGLAPAPVGLQQQLNSVPRLGNDGVSRDLTNVMGSGGSFESGSLATWDGNGTSVLTIDTSTKQFGNQSLKVAIYGSNGYGAPYTSVPIDRTKYYLIGMWMKQNNTTKSMIYLDSGLSSASIGKASATVTDTGNFQLCYVVVQPSDFASNATSLAVHPYFYGSNGSYGWVDGIFLYQIDQTTYNNINTGATGFATSSDIAAKFPYVSSYPNVIQNFLPDFTNSGWTIVSQATVTNPNLLTLNGTALYQTSSISIPVAGSTSYLFSMISSSGLAVEAHDSSGALISTLYNANYTSPVTLNTPANTATLLIKLFNNTATGTFTFANAMLEKVNTGISYPNKFVPYGSWIVPYDYHNGDTPTRFDAFYGGGRTYLSDAQISETITDVVEPLKTSQKHITVTQATAGQWAVNDTIKITSYDGIASGVIDSDTALAKVTAAVPGLPSPATISVDDVSKIAVNDTLIAWVKDLSANSLSLTVTAVDTTNKTITVTWASGTLTLGVGDFFVETTASSSSPVVSSASGNIAGTWSGLGTKTATYTITTAPSTNTDSIKVQYSVNYPAGKGITQVPTIVDDGKVNGDHMVKASDGIVHVKANFVGKVSGNTDAVPHSGLYQVNNFLTTPTQSWYENATQDYATISYLDGSSLSAPATTRVSTGISQQMFKFDVIRALTDRLGDGVFADCVTLADKVAKAKNILVKLTCSWYGYGAGPNGNKATLGMWNSLSSAWQNSGDATTITTSSTVTKLTIYTGVAGTTISSQIDANGYMYCFAYADASDGTTSSIVYTDYVELELQINLSETGYDVLIPDNQFPDMSENVLSRNQAYPMDTTGFNTAATYNTNTATASIDSAGVLKVTADGTLAYQGININGVAAPSGMYSASIMFKGTAGTSYLFLFVDKVGSGQKAAGSPFTATGDWQLLKQEGLSQSIGTVGLCVTTGPTAVASTFYVKQLKINPGPTATPWTPGRKKTRVLNFLGKVAGSTFENPHRSYWQNSASLALAPQSLDSLTATDFVNISQVDGTLANLTVANTGQYAQQIFEFDLSHFGMSLTELKNAIRGLSVNWTGYGSGDNAGTLTNGATLQFWDVANSTWDYNISNTTAAPSTITQSVVSQYLTAYITSTQKFYVLVHSTYPASATNPSKIYTDYINLQVTLADYVDYVPATPVKVRKETKEIKLAYPMKSLRYGVPGDIELNYRYLPYQAQAGRVNTVFKTLSGLPYVLLTKSGTGGLLKNANNYTNKPVIPNLPLNKGADADFAPKYYTDIPTTAVTNTSVVSNSYGEYPTIKRARILAITGNSNDPSDIYDITRYTVGYSHTPTVRGSGNAFIDAASSMQGSPNILFETASQDTNELAVHALLVWFDGELFMLVTTVRNYAGITGGHPYSANGDRAMDLFSLSGKPLVKGGY